MNKTELIAAVAENAGMSKKDGEKAVNAVLEAITGALVAGDKVQLVGFGTFDVNRCCCTGKGCADRCQPVWSGGKGSSGTGTGTGWYPRVPEQGCTLQDVV